MLVGRTGYTGEDGFELYIDNAHAADLWRALEAAGAEFDLLACGLACRDTLRLEAGMPLYGHELSLDLKPVQVGMEKVTDVGEKHYNVLLRDNKTGLLGPKGWEVPPVLEVDLILPGSEGLFPAKKSGKFGFIDNSGNWIVGNQYDEVGTFKEGIAAFRQDEKWGFINNQGTEITGADYEQVSFFHKGKAIVKQEGKHLLIGKDGKPILEKTYDRISLAADNYYISENEDKFGLISPEGKEIVEPKFQELRREDLNKILVRLGDKYGILDENGDYVLPVYYKSIVFDSGNNQILAEDDYQFAPAEPIENINIKKKKGA